jgi:hypothetical protein
LLDADVGRVEADVELYRLRRLLPFVQVASFPAAYVEDEKLLAAGAAQFARPRGVVFVGGIALDDAALDPVVEDAETLDLAVRRSPLSSPLGDVVVVLPHDIVNASHAGVLCRGRLLRGLIALSLQLTLSNGLALGFGYASPCSWTLLLARLLRR